MNEKIAVQIMKKIIVLNYPDNSTVFREALDLAIKALEKQIPKKPIMGKWNPARCPSCDEALSESAGDGYYRHNSFLDICDCGQKLNWNN